MSGKPTAILAELLGARPDMSTVEDLLKRGWRVKHDEGTAFISMVHPSGGSFSLVEVKTHGTPLTVGESDLLAAMVAEHLAEQLNEFALGPNT